MRNCLVIDLDRCSGCDSCIAACKLENNVDLGVYYNRVHAVGPTGTFPDLEQYWLPLQCLLRRAVLRRPRRPRKPGREGGCGGGRGELPPA